MRCDWPGCENPATGVERLRRQHPYPWHGRCDRHAGTAAGAAGERRSQAPLDLGRGFSAVSPGSSEQERLA